jgi:hypothetical protein
MPETIMRSGDPAMRAKASNDVSEFGILKAEYRLKKKAVEDAEEHYDNEKDKLARLSNEINVVSDNLSAVQEEIDSDPLPEGAQPRERIHRRDRIKLVDSILSSRI